MADSVNNSTSIISPFYHAQDPDLAVLNGILRMQKMKNVLERMVIFCSRFKNKKSPTKKTQKTLKKGYSFNRNK